MDIIKILNTPPNIQRIVSILKTELPPI